MHGEQAISRFDFCTLAVLDFIILFPYYITKQKEPTNKQQQQ